MQNRNRVFASVGQRQELSQVWNLCHLDGTEKNRDFNFYFCAIEDSGY